MKISFLRFAAIFLLAASCNRFNQTYNVIPPLPSAETNFSEKNLLVLNSLIKEDDENDELYWQRSILFQKMSKPAESLKDIKKAIELDNNKYHYFKVLAQAYLLNKKHDSSIIAAKYSREAGNNDYQLNLILAEAYLNKGNIKESLSEISDALKIDPNYYHSYYLRGMAYKHKGDSLQALEDFSKAFQINPTDKGVYNELLSYYLYHKDLNKSKELLGKMFTNHAPDANMLMHKGHFYEIQNKSDSAYLFYKDAVDRDSSLYSIELKLGNIKLKNKEYNPAIAHFQNVLKQKSDIFEAQYKLAICLESVKSYPESLSEFQKSLALDTGNVIVRSDLARVNLKLKKNEEVEKQRLIRDQQKKVILLPEIPTTTP